jgi:hypothetical protein
METKTYGPYGQNRFEKYERNVQVKPTTAKPASSGYAAKERQQNAPVKKFKAGAISATIWENQTRNDQGQIVSFKNVTFERVYKDVKGEWQTTNGLRANDLPKAVLVLQKAYEYLAFDESNAEE